MNKIDPDVMGMQKHELKEEVMRLRFAIRIHKTITAGNPKPNDLTLYLTLPETKVINGKIEQ